MNSIVEKILQNRKILDRELFLHPPHPLTFSLSSLGFAKELRILLTHLEQCKKKGQNVVIYTDYDADGITGGSLLWETLHLLGFSAFPYVPHRQKEGYGFSIKGIDAVIEKYHPGVIISVDHGISARDQIKYASEKGIPIIVTDHHTKPELLPASAVALIHCPLVSGSGLAYITALDLWRTLDPQNETLKRLFTYDFLALASIGTIADLVPLLGYSRSIAKFGLQAFSQATKPGIRELLAVAGLAEGEMTTHTVGFALAPRINAVGRLSHAIEAVRMLCTKDVMKAKRLAHEAQNHNTMRQKMVETAVQEAFSIIETAPIPPLILQKNCEWNEGIIGLISSKITERYHRASIIMTKTETGWKGSARSVRGFDIIAFLRSLNVLKHVGGHPQAAGFSVTNDDVIIFEKALENQLGTVPLAGEKIFAVDTILPMKAVTESLADDLQELAPFGVGNPTPLFQSSVTISFLKTMGKKQQHLRFVAQDTIEKSHQVECIYFSPDAVQKKILETEKKVTIVYTIEVNYWLGKKQVKCFIKTVSQMI